jgi:predicted NACHT family NTPase
VCLGLAAAVYLYDHRGGVAEQDRDEAVPSDPEIDRRNRQVFINDMRRRFAERLDSAPRIIRLRLAERMGAVEPPGLLIRPYDIARRQPGHPDEVLPARMRIVDLYDQHNAQLLILGAPGAGKTFLLYELAHDLVERAAANEAAPVPVIFSLAAWRPGQSLELWMIADLGPNLAKLLPGEDFFPMGFHFFPSGTFLPSYTGT